MSLIDQAINDGVEAGIFEAFADKIEEMGGCYDEPEERCVMRPKDGCVCLYRRWQRLPWYRRIFRPRPRKPLAKNVQSAAIRLIVEEAVSDIRIERAKALRRSGGAA